MSIFEVIVVGAGPAGLVASYYLKHLGLEHIVFDQGRTGETWRSQRWDNFRMITSFRHSLLPGASLKTRLPDAYGSASDMVGLLEEYAGTFQLPVTEQARVLSVEKQPDTPVFRVKVLQDNEIERTYEAWQVIVAVGACNQPVIPPIAEALPATIVQLHASQYRNAEKLVPGAVLVVGAGQSGREIAQDLVVQGRRVFLSGGPHSALRRTYRGREIFHWLSEARLLQRTAGDVDASPRMPVIAYPVDENLALDMISLESQGVGILGKLESVDVNSLRFAGVSESDATKEANVTKSWLDAIDRYIAANKITAPAATEAPSPDLSTGPSTLDIDAHKIRTIVWATGFRDSFQHIVLPVDTSAGISHGRGVTALDGLYLVGAGRQSGSDYIAGLREDASYVTNRIYGVLR